MNAPHENGSSNGAADGKRVPCSTYRLQFNGQFTFEQATTIVDYLNTLGITDLYASPLFKASADSTHGYDVCSYEQFHPSLGSPGEFESLVSRLQGCGMGLLLDVVPNHMRADISNGWWADVLEKGQRSKYSEWFDIDWNAPDEGLQGKVLLPVLGGEPQEVLRAGELRVVFENSGFFIGYYNNRFPLAVECYPLILREMMAILQPPEQQMMSALTAVAESVAVKKGEITADFEDVKRRFAELLVSSLQLSRALENVLQCINGLTEPGQSLALPSLLAQQHYHLAFWKSGLTQINYRRFFDVSSLVSVNVQNAATFEASHRFLGCLLREGKVNGIRVDHPDGLWDPKEYFERLQCLPAKKGSLYVVAEKILSGDELLPREWPVDGSTGYDFLNQLNGLFVNSANAARFDHIYKELTGSDADFQSVVEASKRKIVETSFRSEVRSIALRLGAIARACGHNFPAKDLQAAVAETVVGFQVYRTYISGNSAEPSQEDTKVITQAITAARARVPETAAAPLSFLQDVLLLRRIGDAPHRQVTDFIMKFQQLTGPAMAKGLEDTCFYTFNRLVSLNEVGGEPGHFGNSIENLHEHNTIKSKYWPNSLLATATHDTKRGEDCRARLNVLSEIPAEWFSAVQRWQSTNSQFKRTLHQSLAPHANDEYLLYQTLVGAWPFSADQTAPAANKEFRSRINEYMLKAIREGKQHTSWTEQNADYETAVSEFVYNILDNKDFLSDLVALQRRVAYFGQFNSYAQVLLKVASPGVPDFYQGTELWDFSLVDPDNRRPIDYQQRKELLSLLEERVRTEQRDRLIEELLQTFEVGTLKLYIVSRALQFRRRHQKLFQCGTYIPLRCSGPKSEHAIAFARQWEGREIIAVAPRLIVALTRGKQVAPVGDEVWQDTWLTVPSGSAGKYKDVFSGATISTSNHGDGDGVRIADILRIAPVALLERVAG